MTSRSLYRRRFTALFLLLAALPASPAVLLAQEVQGPQEPAAVPPAEMEGIGPPQLRRYQLPGERITPPQPQAAPTPAPVREPPERPASEPPAAVRVREAGPDQLPARESSPSPQRTTADQSAAVPGDEATAPLIDPAAALPVPAPDTTEFAPPPPPAPEGAEEVGTDLTVYWPYLLALAIGGALVVLLLRMPRRRHDEDRVEFQIVDDWTPAPTPEPTKPPLPAQVRASVPPPAPAPDRPAVAPPAQPKAPPPPAADVPSYLLRPGPSASKPAASVSATAPAKDELIGIQIRPWLQLQFKPDRAAATLTEAAVQYELTIANTGNAVARNILVETRMFNADAAQEAEIKEFFAAPVRGNGNGRILAIPARNAANLRSVVTMPKEDVREIEVNGRRLFIPTVAINVSYEWGNGKTGRTSASYIVGREPEKPSSKMGPFRLDLGPRIYRQVGQRPSQPAVLV